MSEMTSDAQRQETSEPSIRCKIVDILEHCYGPLLLSIGFGVFLTLDSAREVMVVFASEIVALVLQIGTYWPGVLVLAALFFLVFAFGSRSVDQDAAALERRDYVRQAGKGGLLAVAIVAFVTIGFALMPTTWQPVIMLPGRVFLGVFAFFYVPIILWWATGYTLKAERGNIDDHVFDSRKSAPEGSIGAIVLTFCGRIPLFLAGYALFTEGFGGLVDWVAGGPVELPGGIWGQEAEGAEALTLVILSLIVLGVAVIRWLAPKMNEDAIGGSIRTAPFGAAFVGVFVLISFIFPNQTLTVMAGPIAISSMFVIVASILLAALTYLSKLPRSGDFPLVLILIGFAIAAGSAGGALAMIVAALVLVYVFARRWDQRGWRLAGLGLAGCFAVLWLAQTLSPFCRTAAGCNIIQGVELPSELPDTHDSAREAFVGWMGERPDLDTVTLVAAQGGGLFAAYHAAYDLAYRQDRSVEDDTAATFADGLFAVSGVSGGSFGAATFWAIRASGICERWAADRTLFDVPEEYPGCYTFLTSEILDRDYLSLSLSGLLFADLIDSILPYSALFAEPVDRGHRFTEQYIGAVDEVLRSHGAEDVDRILDAGLRQSWTASGATPLLFLNTTDLYTGDRVVQSPLTAFLPRIPVKTDEEAPPATRPARVRILDNSGTERDLTVANAAVLSARFPIVSPPGRYRECTDETCAEGRLKQIADGGYFDNTGLETIADILTAIEPELGDTAVRVISYSISEQTEEEREAARLTKGTLAAPIGGVIAATTARRALTVDRFCERWIKNSDSRDADNAKLDLTEGATHNFTLSWLLSTDSFGEIAAKVAGYHDDEQVLCR